MAKRREFLESLSAMLALASTTQAETLPALPVEKPRHHIRFAVCGVSYDHIHGMIGAVTRGGGELVAWWGEEADKQAEFSRRYPNAKVARSQDEVLHDPTVQLVLSSQIASQRAGIGVRAMRAGKDFLSDKPGITTLEDLALVRRTIAETGRIYAIMYSERLEVKAAVYAGELIKAGAIGKVVQTINIAPHQVIQPAGDNGGGSQRPGWFWEDIQYGGILCDIGSHQIDQFPFYTGSTKLRSLRHRSPISAIDMAPLLHCFSSWLSRRSSEAAVMFLSVGMVMGRPSTKDAATTCAGNTRSSGIL
jgi:predicted dehydrogenase